MKLKLKDRQDERYIDLPIRQIRPNAAQPRKKFDDEELYSLAESIGANGILQPLTVRKAGEKEYELIAGERRLRAAVIAGLTKIPCIVLSCTDEQSALFALVENLQRVDLGMFEEARGIARLIKNYGLTQEEAAEKLGKKQSTIANKLRLLRLTIEEQDWISHANLSERHARALLKIESEELRRDALSKIITDNLTIGEAEEYISSLLNGSADEEKPQKQQKKKIIIRDIKIFVNTIQKAVDTMRTAGIDAQTDKQEFDEYIEYTVKIPKLQAYKQNKPA